MIDAAIIRMGTWRRNLINSVKDRSDLCKFVAGATRTWARAAAFAKMQ